MLILIESWEMSRRGGLKRQLSKGVQSRGRRSAQRVPISGLQQYRHSCINKKKKFPFFTLIS